jgi:hypothetical protein
VISDLGFGVYSLGCRVSNLRFWVWVLGVGFMVLGLGLRL